MDVRHDAAVAVSRVREWMRKDPKNFVLVVTAPLTVWETISQIRWQRAHGRGAFSLRGALAYARARPGRFAYGLVLSVLPNVVEWTGRRRKGGHGTDPST